MNCRQGCQVKTSVAPNNYSLKRHFHDALGAAGAPAGAWAAGGGDPGADGCEGGEPQGKLGVEGGLGFRDEGLGFRV